MAFENVESSVVVIVCFGIAFSTCSYYPAFPPVANQFSQAVDAVQRNDTRTFANIVHNPNFTRTYDINAPTANGTDTLLNLAIAKGNYDMVKLLIDYGANVNQTVTYYKKYERIKDINVTKLTPLEVAAKYNQPQIAELLIARRAQLPFNDGNYSRRSALHWAIYAGFESFVKLLVQRGQSNVNEIIDQNGTTLLHFAVKLKSTKKAVPITKLLLKNGADANAQDVNGRTPIFYTAQLDKLDLTKLLIKYNGSVNHKDKQGKTPLHVAAESGAVFVVNELLRKGARVNLKTRSGETALHSVAKNSKNKYIAKALIANKINIHARDNANKTAADYVNKKKKGNAELYKILTGNNALTLCANIILISLLLFGTMIIDRLQ